MWDVVIAIGNLILLPSLLPTLLDKRSYVPRITSGFAVIGLSFIVVGLVGEGFVISPFLTSSAAALWAFIFLFRGKPITD
jgi:predicted tellurium resistance membrane protein TerC